MPYEVETGLNLGCEIIPQLQWEVDIGGGKGCYKRILKCLDGPFRRIDSVVVWLNKLQFALVFG